VNPSAAHLTPPRASTPAFFVADAEGLLEVELEEEEEVDVLSVPLMRPCTVAGAVVPDTLAAAAWYMARVFDPSALRHISPYSLVTYLGGE